METLCNIKFYDFIPGDLSFDLFFSGDFVPSGRIYNLVNNSTALDEYVKPICDLMTDTSIHVSNLESPITNNSGLIKKTGPPIKANPDSINILKAFRVNLACLSNNHIRDYGDIGVKDTLNICKTNGIDTIGAGIDNREAEKVFIKEISGVKIAFLNYCENEFSVSSELNAGANGYNPYKVFYDIKEAKSLADFIVIIFHGGKEYYELPSPGTKQIFHYFADLGANLVIGHHTHVIGSYEIYNNVPLFYSLGNFLFDDDNSLESWFKGLFVKVRISKNGIAGISIFLIKQHQECLKISIVEGKELSDFKLYFENICKITRDDVRLNEEWNKYVHSLNSSHIISLLSTNYFNRLNIKKRIFNYYLRDSKYLTALNLVRCETHKEILIKQLESLINDINI